MFHLFGEDGVERVLCYGAGNSDRFCAVEIPFHPMSELPLYEDALTAAENEFFVACKDLDINYLTNLLYGDLISVDAMREMLNNPEDNTDTCVFLRAISSADGYELEREISCLHPEKHVATAVNYYVHINGELYPVTMFYVGDGDGGFTVGGCYSYPKRQTPYR